MLLSNSRTDATQDGCFLTLLVIAPGAFLYYSLVTNALIVYTSVIAFITVLISRWKQYGEFLEGKQNGDETRLQ